MASAADVIDLTASPARRPSPTIDLRDSPPHDSKRPRLNPKAGGEHAGGEWEWLEKKCERAARVLDIAAPELARLVIEELRGDEELENFFGDDFATIVEIFEKKDALVSLGDPGPPPPHGPLVAALSAGAAAAPRTAAPRARREAFAPPADGAPPGAASASVSLKDPGSVLSLVKVMFEKGQGKKFSRALWRKLPLRATDRGRQVLGLLREEVLRARGSGDAAVRATDTLFALLERAQASADDVGGAGKPPKPPKPPCPDIQVGVMALAIALLAYLDDARSVTDFLKEVATAHLAIKASEGFLRLANCTWTASSENVTFACELFCEYRGEGKLKAAPEFAPRVVAVAAGIALQFPKQVTEDEHWASAALYGLLDRGLLKHVVKNWPKDAGDPYARLFPAARKLRAFIEGNTSIGCHFGRPANGDQSLT